MSKFNLNVIILVLLLTCSVAKAATTTVLITGTVLPVLTIAIAGGTPSFNITPEAAVTDQNLGTITINSNDPDGYDVTLESTNTGGLKNGDADETIAYTVKYNGGAAITLVASATNVESVSVAPTDGDQTRTLTLSILGADSKNKSAEAFTDTITMEILGK
jgi:VCBS repeat-containing protein